MNDSPQPAAPPASVEFPVVGIGASAGGLKALQNLFERIPASTGMAFVVILHLSPRHKSNLDKLLQAKTSMPVLQVEREVRIEKDHVYVIPPAKDLTVVDGSLRVSAPQNQRGAHMSIDLFFRTLANAKKSRAICIVLSGSGTDGTVGLQRVKEQGGIGIAQDPNEAEYDGMPRSSIATGGVDFVLPIAEIPRKLEQLRRAQYSIQLPHDDDVAEELEAERHADRALREILAMLRARTGHDFLQYKRATVLRRIERRLQVNALRDLPTYRDYLRENVGETVPLLRDMLISVTNFFRDRDAFDALERGVVPALFRHKTHADQVRAWVVGCATGEEAYSIAILLTEYADTVQSPPSIQIFATDIDEDAVGFARAALYPEGIAADVTPARLRRHFTKETGGYRIHTAIRERVMFAMHDLIADPPFSKLDLVCCRNLLIYLNRDVQGRILHLLHFALRPDGYLFLGMSESVDGATDLFAPVDKPHRLFASKPRPHSGGWLPMLAMEPKATPAMVHVAQAAPSKRPSIYGELHQSLLELYAPPSVVIDEQYDVVHLSNSAERFLRLGAGEPSLNLLRIVHRDLRLDLRAALYEAMNTMKSVLSRRIAMQHEGKTVSVNVTVHPVRNGATSRVYALVLFDESTDAGAVPVDASLKREPFVAQLESELEASRSQLRLTVEQYETQTEELKASNEELQAINEELRSATEELETGKEELQSINEELTTVNHELKEQVDETTSANNDLQNFIGATDIAVIFVDRELCLKRFTPPAKRLFNLLDSDVGRRLLDVTHRLRYDRFEDDLASVFETLHVVERELQSNDGAWFLFRILPYRTLEDRIEGAVLTAIDITERRGAEAGLRRGEQRYRAIIEGVHDYAIFTMDLGGRVETWNAGAQRVFGYADAEIIGQPVEVLFTPEDRADGLPEQEMSAARRTGSASDERWHVRKDGTRFYASGILAPLSDNALFGYVKIARDETGRQQEIKERERRFAELEAIRTELEAASKLKDRFLATLSHELRNPLNLILMQSELLRRADTVKGDEKLRRAADIIHQMVNAQARLIDDLLDIARFRTGKLAIQQQLVPLPFVIGDSIGALQHEMELKKIVLDVDLASEPLIIQADPVRVKQIAWNLFSNALKFTPTGGHIQVRVRRDGASARLDVEDSGQGIAPDFLPHVFEFFRQADSSNTRRQSGVGIGLALVHQLVELHGGRIEAHSAGENRGSCFSVWFPLYVVPDAAPAVAPASPGVFRERRHDGGSAPVPPSAAERRVKAPGATTGDQGHRLEGVRALVVDDDETGVFALRDLLEDESAQVTVATQAADALELARTTDFDVVISDIAMPEIDGHAMLRKLRAGERNAQVPAIACTGFGSSEDIARAQRSGFVAQFTKPVEVERLIAVIRDLVGQRKP